MIQITSKKFKSTKKTYYFKKGFCLLIVAIFISILNTDYIKILNAQQAATQNDSIKNLLFPMKTNDSFAATFIEFRRGHLHAGCDLRTLRKTGLPVTAPADGVISSLHGDESGYGNMLKLEGNDGSIHSFAHLSAFENKTLELNKYVEQHRQQNFKRYPYDIDVKKYSIKVKKGQVIAFSGATGAGPAHLHYEVHDKNEVYLNPLKLFNDENSKDITNPTIHGFYIIPQDENSLINGIPLKKYYSFSNSGEKPLVINAIGKFALCVRAYDENKFIPNNESKTGIYRIFLNYNGKKLYSVFFEACHKVFMSRPEYVYDILSSSYSNGNFYYNLFNLTSSSSKPEYISADNSSETGIFEIKKGEHVKIELAAFDCAGNNTMQIFELNGSESAAVSLAQNIKMNSNSQRAGIKNKTNKKKQTPKSSSTGISKNIKKAKAGERGSQSNTIEEKPYKLESGSPEIRLEYAENALIYNILGVPPGNEISMFIEETGGARKELKPFTRGPVPAGENIFFARGYDDAVKNPTFYIEIKNSSRQRIFYEGYKSIIFQAQPETEISAPEMNNYSLKISEYSNMAKSLYFGKLKPDKLNSAETHEKSGTISLGFSQLITSAKIFYKITDETFKNPKYGIYFVYKKEKSFINNAVEKIGRESFMTGRIKYIKSFSAGIFKDETNPQLKISKSSAKKISKPLVYSPLPDANFISFSAVDKESGISRDTVKYYIDGKKCENYELIDGWALNCYIKNYADANANAKGQHNVKVELYDNSGNKTTFEKNINIK